MKNRMDDLKAKPSLLNELSELEQQRRFQTINRIANLPFLNDLPEIKDLREQLNSADKKQEYVEIKHKEEVLHHHDRVPPTCSDTYTSGFGGQIGYPLGFLSPPGPPSESTGLYNPFIDVDPSHKEISLSAIYGHDGNIFYVGEAFSDLVTLYHSSTFGTICQRFNFMVEYPFPLRIRISAIVRLPVAGVYELYPGDFSSNLHGLVGAEGSLDLWATQDGNDIKLSNVSSNDFLNAYKIDSPNFAYENHFNPNPFCIIEFVLPANVRTFCINVSVRIAAISANKYPPVYSSGPYLKECALIDLRADRFFQNHPILNQWWNGFDHDPAGPITVDNICVRWERVLRPLPDDSHRVH